MEQEATSFAALDSMRASIRDFAISDADTLEQFRIRFLGSKNVLKDLFTAIREIPPAQKKEYGAQVNALKELAQSLYAEAEIRYRKKARQDSERPDLSLPVNTEPFGARHPLTIIREELLHIFTRLGYSAVEGPEIEDDWHNFTALGMPEDHPARDMQDTFYIQSDPAILLRTHTSNVQIRVMEKQKPPIRIIAMGRTYRNETISARAHATFHQVELLYVDEGVHFGDMKQTLLYLAQELYGPDTQIRLRPSYFPFTEPSAELDITCFVCGGEGCAICKHTGWVEIGGCGMVDPLVLENCGIDPEHYTGFAFGLGLERMAILKYRIPDIRLFTENDIRFLQQFSGW